jgi:hypothetical protein
MRNKRTNFRRNVAARQRAGELESQTSDASALPSRVERRAAKYRPGLYLRIMADQGANRAYLNIGDVPRRAAR